MIAWKIEDYDDSSNEKYFLNEAKALKHILKLYSERLEDYKDITIKDVQEDIGSLLQGDLLLDRYALVQIEINEEK